MAKFRGALIALFLLASPSAFAEPVQDYHKAIKATGFDPAAASIATGTLVDFAKAGQDRRISIRISKVLKPEQQENLEARKVRSVLVDYLADPSLFDDPKLFTGVEEFSLVGKKDHESHLRALSKNYPNIRFLLISGPPLSDTSVEILQNFKSLRTLEIQCALASPEKLLNLPQSIEQLRLSDPSPLPKMSNLTDLALQYCRLTSDFWTNLKAPKLSVIRLNHVDVVPGAFRQIDKNSNLRILNIYSSNIDSAELNYLRPLDKTAIDIRAFANDYSNHGPADGVFKRQNFAGAIDYDQQVAYTHPTAEIYLQMARCYVGTGFPKKAIQYCDYAAKLNQKDPEIAAVKKEALQLAGEQK